MATAQQCLVAWRWYRESFAVSFLPLTAVSLPLVAERRKASSWGRKASMRTTDDPTHMATFQARKACSRSKFLFRSSTKISRRLHHPPSRATEPSQAFTKLDKGVNHSVRLKNGQKSPASWRSSGPLAFTDSRMETVVSEAELPWPREVFFRELGSFGLFVLVSLLSRPFTHRTTRTAHRRFTNVKAAAHRARPTWTTPRGGRGRFSKTRLGVHSSLGRL
mmetsp:Transcript_26291/g.63358  ORF Transcript_26291/g.63358 Transcript_26291/m.63358 type:complete len:220 (+) Transcript_26291:529-1188(+)